MPHKLVLLTTLASVVGAILGMPDAENERFKATATFYWENYYDYKAFANASFPIDISKWEKELEGKSALEVLRKEIRGHLRKFMDAELAERLVIKFEGKVVVMHKMMLVDRKINRRKELQENTPFSEVRELQDVIFVGEFSVEKKEEEPKKEGAPEGSD